MATFEELKGIISANQPSFAYLYFKLDSCIHVVGITQGANNNNNVGKDQDINKQPQQRFLWVKFDPNSPFQRPPFKGEYRNLYEALQPANNIKWLVLDA